MEIKAVQRTVYHIGKRHYFSLLGACRQRARIKIMKRLAAYFRERSEEENNNAHLHGPCGRLETYKQWQERVHPSKTRYKKMRERLTRTIYEKMKRQPS